MAPNVAEFKVGVGHAKAFWHRLNHANRNRRDAPNTRAMRASTACTESTVSLARNWTIFPYNYVHTFIARCQRDILSLVHACTNYSVTSNTVYPG